MQKLQDSVEWRCFAAAGLENQLKASKLYQFRLDDSPCTRSNACCPPCRERFAVDAFI
jgi:hypothetical protein